SHGTRALLQCVPLNGESGLSIGVRFVPCCGSEVRVCQDAAAAVYEIEEDVRIGKNVMLDKVLFKAKNRHFGRGAEGGKLKPGVLFSNRFERLGIDRISKGPTRIRR